MRTPRNFDANGAAPPALKDLLPPGRSISFEFNDGRNHWVRAASRWSYDGIPSARLCCRPGVRHDHAVDHLRRIMATFRVSHDVRVRSVAYLASLWFTDSGER